MGTKSVCRNPSGFKRVSPTFSRFERCMLRRAIDSMIEGIERRPKRYMKFFNVDSDETLRRTVTSLNSVRGKLRL